MTPSSRERELALSIENQRLAAAHAAAEQRLGHLAVLNAAVLRLHESLDPEAVLTTIKEIVANLLGSEEMGIYARRPDGALTLLDGIGCQESRCEVIAPVSGPADQALTSGTPWLATGRPAPDQLAACIPLVVGGRSLGAILVHRLLPQKVQFEPVDRELCALLSTHAALALHHAELRASAALPESA